MILNFCFSSIISCSPSTVSSLHYVPVDSSERYAWLPVPSWPVNRIITTAFQVWLVNPPVPVLHLLLSAEHGMLPFQLIPVYQASLFLHHLIMLWTILNFSPDGLESTVAHKGHANPQLFIWCHFAAYFQSFFPLKTQHFLYLKRSFSVKPFFVLYPAFFWKPSFLGQPNFFL